MKFIVVKNFSNAAISQYRARHCHTLQGNVLSEASNASKSILSNRKAEFLFIYHYTTEVHYAVDVVQQAVCWLIRTVPSIQILGQTFAKKRNMPKIFLRKLPFSRFRAITLRVKSNCYEMFLKNLSFGVNFKLQILPFMYEINTHNIIGEINWVVILIKEL